VSSKQHIVGAICARGGSKGVARKNIRPLNGRPLIYYTIECARLCPELDRTVISTDDNEFAQIARQYGADVPFMRPAHLAQDTSSKWDVFRNLVETLESMNQRRVDILVDLDTGVPLRKPEDITACIKTILENDDVDVVVTAYTPDRNPYFNMVEVNAEGYATVSKPMGAAITRRQDAPKVYGLSPAVYAIRRDALWKYDHWAHSKMKICLMPHERAVDIDTELDFRFVEFLMTKQNPE
jgi:N-acylneuraminate cytidylyltransferase/CMP-N,N'-diacetyllegionaminic acid synthase